MLREASKDRFVTATQRKDPAAKLAYLTRAVRNDPTNQVASITLEQLITRQSDFQGHRLSLSRHDANLITASFSPDGQWVVTASEDGTARVWEMATGKAVGQPLRHNGVIKSVAFSPDGKRVVTASADGTARVWEAATGKAVGEPLRHDGVVSSAALTLTGQWR